MLLFSEISNTLLMTYITTEYAFTIGKETPVIQFLKSFLQRNRVLLVVVLLLNGLEYFCYHHYYSDVVRQMLKQSFDRILHAPKVLLAAALYTITLYTDCRRHLLRFSSIPSLRWKEFLIRVGQTFWKILPLYPFLAILISCGFLFVTEFWQRVLRLPLRYLEGPIYYGTLYGPFSIVYFRVKKQVVEEAAVGKYHYSLPLVRQEETFPSAPSQRTQQSLSAAELQRKSLEAALKRRDAAKHSRH